MSNRTLLIWLAIALVLAGLGWLVLKNSGGSRGRGEHTLLNVGDRLVQFVPSDVTSVRVQRQAPAGSPAIPTELLTRDADTGEWSLRIARPAAAGETPDTAVEDEKGWPVSQGRVDSLLRELSAATAVAQPPEGASIGDDATVVTLQRANGSPITLRFASSALGGTLLAQVDAVPASPSSGPGNPGSPATSERLAIVPAELHDVFRNPGPRAWRNPAVLPGLDPSISRLAMDSAGGVIVFARQGNRWIITEPEAAAGSTADPETVLKLIQVIGSITIADFLDDPAATATQSTGLDRPAARIVVETHRRVLDTPDTGADSSDSSDSGESAPNIEIDRRELAIGGPCGTGGAGGDRLFASVTAGEESRLVCINAQGIAGLALDPIAYVSPRMSEVQVSDIGTIAIEPYSEQAGGMEGKLIQRRLDKWVIVRQDGTETVLPDAEAGPVDALLAFLTATPAGVNDAVRAAREAGPIGAAALHTPPTVDMGEGGSRRNGASGGGGLGFRMSMTAPNGFTPTGRIMLLSISGSPLDRIDLGVLAGGSSSPAAGRLICRTGKVYRSYPVDRVPQLLQEVAMPGGGTVGTAGKPPMSAEDKAKVPVETAK